MIDPVFLSLITPISLIIGIVVFFVSLRIFLRSWRRDDIKDYQEHKEQTRDIKRNTYSILENQEKQSIHQEYMKKVFDEFTKTINRNNELIAHLTSVMEMIKEELRRHD